MAVKKDVLTNIIFNRIDILNVYLKGGAGENVMDLNIVENLDKKVNVHLNHIKRLNLVLDRV